MNKSVFLSVSLAAVLGVSSCGAAGAPGPAARSGASAQSSAAGTPPAPSPSASARETSAPAIPPSASAAPSPAKPAATPAASPAATPRATPTAAPVPPASDGLTSYTFPDGHLSFSYPANWTTRVEKTAPSGNQPPGVDPVQVVLADQTGNVLLAVTSNAYGGGVSGPVLRTVLDNAPVPGLKDTSGEQLDYGFAFDSFAEHPEFHMGIRRSREFEPSPEGSGSTLVPLPNGLLDTRVLFDTPAFPSVDAAKAWMATGQYASLKRLLLSVRYQ
jgi:hypothetical protein